MTRTAMHCLRLAVILCSVVPAVAQEGDQPAMTDDTTMPLVLVGSYAPADSEGIYVCRMDPTTGALEPLSAVSGIANPSFLAVDPAGTTVYAVQEVGPEGAVVAYALDRRSATLTRLNEQPSHGAAPCHIAVDATGRAVVVANYTSGTVSAYPILDGGRLGEAASVMRHEGSSVDPGRQEGPHAHSVTPDPTNRFVLAADLGLDKIMVYRLDPATATLTPHDPPSAGTSPGAGPRHFAFHPSGRFGYVVNELDSTITAFAYDADSGTLEPIETVPALPGNYEAASFCADIHVGPSGERLYASNRGHDSIVIYRIAQDTGRLTYVGHEPTGGQTPRSFCVDPTGRWLLAANQQTGSIVTFAIDAETGELTPAGPVLEVSAPVCIVFVPDGR